MHVLAPMKFRLAYLLLLFFAFSCGRGNPALRQAERVIEDHPDSALYILDGISRVDLASEREKAEYDFLSAEAFYRTYYFLDDASEAALERACLYFEANGPAVERMRAWELMGTIQTAVGRYGSGMVSFRKAGAVARDIERSRSRLGMLALLVAGVLATLVLYFWARKIQTERLLAEKQAENERYLSAAEDLQSKLSALKADRPRMGGIDTLDRLCEQYYVFEGTSNLQPRILNEVKAIVEGLRSDTKTQKNLEQALDERAGGVMKPPPPASPPPPSPPSWRKTNPTSTTASTASRSASKPPPRPTARISWRAWRNKKSETLRPRFRLSTLAPLPGTRPLRG